MTASVEAKTREAVERRLAALERLELDTLRTEWRRVIKTKPSLRISADLLRRGIAYCVQEAAYGGLRLDTIRQLAATARNTSPGVKSASDMKAGTTLIREWHGRTHTVRALEDGFEYEGRRYTSLTKIAYEITGTAWSGPRFFGLVKAHAMRASKSATIDA